jgi:ATP-binding cassette subfamily B protein
MVIVGKTARFYLGLYRSYPREIAVILLLYAVKHGVWLLFPLVIRTIIDVFIPSKNVTGIFLCIPFVVVLGIINLVCHTPYRVISTAVVKNISRDLRNVIINKLQILAISFINKSETGRYYSKIMVDVTRAENFSNTIFGQVLAAVFSLVYSCTFLAIANYRLLPIFLAVLALYLAIYKLFTNRFKKYQHEARMADEDLSQAVSHFIQTNTLSRIHGEEEFEKHKVDEKGIRIVDKHKKIQKSIGIFNILIATTSQIFQLLVVAVAAVFVIAGKLTIGLLVLFYQYMQEMVHATIMIVNLFPTFVESAESIRSIREILDSPDIEKNESKPQIGKIRGRIEFKNVSFAYEKGKPALSDVSVTIEPGTTLALVGPSGSGKTTIVNLVLGLIRPNAGQVCIDGHEINTIDMRGVRKSVGVVTQQPILFRGTVAENISHARTAVSRSEIEDAARKANAHQFITEMPLGYDTIIGEHGMTLSGGQQQRIAIARAILRKPSILVLDEATSALDSLAEREVQKGIDAMLGSQTTLVIAHRLSTIRDADMILVLDQGKVVECGTHEQLLSMNGMYGKLCEAQSAYQQQTV